MARPWPADLLAIADPELLSQIVPPLEATIITPEVAGRVSKDDVAGLQEAKEAISDMLILPRRFPHYFHNSLTSPPRGLLLSGPPGTGKTMLARWIASEVASTFFNISGGTIFSKYVGDPEKTVKILFQLAKQRAPSVIFLDEVDALLSTRGDKDCPSSRRVKNELLQAMDGFAVGTEDVLVIGATNLAWELDPAALSRFAEHISIDLPDAEARRSHLVRSIVKYHNEMDLGRVGLEPEVLDWLVAELEGYSMRGLTYVLRKAALVPTRAACCMLDGAAPGARPKLRRLEKSDFVKAFAQVDKAWRLRNAGVRGAVRQESEVQEDRAAAAKRRELEAQRERLKKARLCKFKKLIE